MAQFSRNLSSCCERWPATFKSPIKFLSQVHKIHVCRYQ